MKLILTPFGIAVRKARLDLEMSLKDMAEATGVSSSFLSAIETGRKLLSDSLYVSIEKLLAKKGVTIPDLRVLADISNKKVSLKGLPKDHARLVSTLAHMKLSVERTSKLKLLLVTARKVSNGTEVASSDDTKDEATA